MVRRKANRSRQNARGAASAASKKRGDYGPSPKPSPPTIIGLSPRQPRRDNVVDTSLVPHQEKRASAHDDANSGENAVVFDGTAIPRSRKKIRQRPADRTRDRCPTLLLMTPSSAPCPGGVPTGFPSPCSSSRAYFPGIPLVALVGTERRGVGVMGAHAGVVVGGGRLGGIASSDLREAILEKNGRGMLSSPWSRSALDRGGRPGEGTTEGKWGWAEDDVESWRNGNAPQLAFLLSDIAAVLEEAAIANENKDHSDYLVGVDDKSWDWSIVDSILGRIPRGGGGDRGGDNERKYPGLVNMGNTCYLNAQLQCAYHIPYLRRLVLDAKDEIVEVEVDVEIEIETDDDDDDEAVTIRENNPTSDCAVAKLDDEIKTKSAGVSTHYQRETIRVINQSKPKRVIVKKVTKKEILPISQALRALQVTFNSLDSSPSSSGTTSVLCRTLGINPYVQQDGQEFWKLFIPEIRYDQLERLWRFDEELAMAVEDYGEEKKDEDDLKISSTEDVKNNNARERIRKELFLDLSIPVSEGIGPPSEECSPNQKFYVYQRVTGGVLRRGPKKWMLIWRFLKRDGLPPLLQLHLKRFKYDYETGETSKINDCCTFPLELDLSEISEKDYDRDDDVEDNAIYDLQSVVIHKGEYGSGHYYSYVRPDIQTNDWYRFDDEFVTRVDYSDVIVDAYGGNCAEWQKQSSIDPDKSIDVPERQRRGLFHRILSLFGLFRRITMIASRTTDRRSNFGYGGRTSNAYMLQYVHRSDIPKLYNNDA
ncbi:LOW QUALITY PROTEIN: hypothetical protein ACHAXA_009508 [Cyclostephanos tholiformis]|uniref:Ubiquitin carboxyl-terminal hydrolase n=1 Tax=Cyclostephanos tholiformis TaxID=382380 RepID=A0ABD3RYE2_9STRA